MKTALFIGLSLVSQTLCTVISSRCSSLMKPCLSVELCRSKTTLLRNICDSEESRCQMQNFDICNATIHAILADSGDCECAEEHPCNILQLLSSFCLTYSELESVYVTEQSGSTTQQTNDHIHPGQHMTSPDLHQDTSCVQEVTLCLQDEVCNRQLVPFVQSCSPPQCDDNLCRIAARRFYSNVHENVAEMLAICQCLTDDRDCQDFQSILSSNVCIQEQMEPWNCLEMLENCTAEKTCRRMFEEFLSKCFISEDISFTGYSNAELLNVIDLNFFVSENKECRRAFIATMGSSIQSMCTCQGLDPPNLYRCNVLQQAIHNRSYFRSQRHKEHISSLNLNMNKPQPENSRQNDQSLYVAVSVCAVVVILIAVAIIIFLHELRKKNRLSKNSSFKPPEDSRKSLVL